MTKSYAGPLGLFAKDVPYDLPQPVVKQLPEDCWQDCPNPLTGEAPPRVDRSPEPEDPPATEETERMTDEQRTKDKEQDSPKDKQVRPDRKSPKVRTK